MIIYMLDNVKIRQDEKLYDFNSFMANNPDAVSIDIDLNDYDHIFLVEFINGSKILCPENISFIKFDSKHDCVDISSHIVSFDSLYKNMWLSGILIPNVHTPTPLFYPEVVRSITRLSDIDVDENKTFFARIVGMKKIYIPYRRCNISMIDTTEQFIQLVEEI